MAKGRVGIPALAPNGNNLSHVVNKIVEIIEQGEGQRGDPLDAKLTWRDLREANLVDFGSITPNRPLSSQVIPPNPMGEAPTTPTNVTATGTYTAIIVEWTPAYYEDHRYTEIWRSVTTNIGDAVLVGQAPASIFADVVGAGKTYNYWVRFVGKGEGNTGPYSSMVSASTALDVADLLNTLSGAITTSQFAQGLNTRLDLMDDPNNTNSVVARLNEEVTTRETETSALAQNVGTLLGISGDNEASIQELTQVKADAQTVNAIYELKTDVNGHVSGFGTINDGEKSQFLINADAFAILPQSGAVTVESLNYDPNDPASQKYFTLKYNNNPARLRQWKPNTAYMNVNGTQTVSGITMAGDVIAPASLTGLRVLYRCVDSGVSGGSEPLWDTELVADGSTQWQRITGLAGPMSPFIVENNMVVIDGAYIRELHGENIKAGTIGADKISATELSAIKSNLGTVTAGKILNGETEAESTFRINITEGYLVVFDEQGNERVRLGRL